MRSRGFIQLSLVGYILAGMGVALLLSWGAVYLQTTRLKAVKSEYTAFVAAVTAKGEAAKKEAEAQAVRDRKNKERTDGQIKRLRADNDSLAERLRLARSASGYLPAPAPGAANPDRACFDRAELDAAIGRLDAGLSRVAGQGDAYRIAVDSLREWAKR